MTAGEVGAAVVNDAALFTCRRHAGGLRLAPQACAQMWQRANTDSPPTRFDHLFPCWRCRIGAAHSGAEIPAEAEDSAAAAMNWLRKHCVRCFGQPSRFIFNSLCIGCYNREREAVVGRNAKGARPRLRLSTFKIFYLEQDRQTARVAHVSAEHEVEAALAVLRRAPRARYLLRRPGLPLVRQSAMELRFGEIRVGSVSV